MFLILCRVSHFHKDNKSFPMFFVSILLFVIFAAQNSHLR